MSALEISVPLTPDPRLNPNDRAGWRARHADKTEQFKAGLYGARAALSRARWHPPPGKIALELHVFWERGRFRPNVRMPDDDNLLASCKAMLDGIAAALELDDSRFKFRGIDQSHDPDGAGCVVVRLTPLEG